MFSATAILLLFIPVACLASARTSSLSRLSGRPPSVVPFLAGGADIRISLRTKRAPSRLGRRGAGRAGSALFAFCFKNYKGDMDGYISDLSGILAALAFQLFFSSLVKVFQRAASSFICSEASWIVWHLDLSMLTLMNLV